MGLILTALALTIVIECTLCIVIFRDFKLTFHMLLCNLLTNPTMNVLLSLIASFAYAHNVNIIATYNISLGIFEVLVVICEAFVLYYIGHSKKKALLTSAILNVSSFLLGLLIVPLI